MRRRLFATALVAFGGCDPKPASPFIVKDSPETRSTFEKHCVNKVTGVSEVPARTDHIVASQGGGCSVRLFFEEKSGAARGLQLIVDNPPGDIRARIETIVLPIVTDDMRRLIQEKVLADVGVDKEIRIDRKGKGSLYYQHETRVPGYHSAIIRLGWH